MMACRFFCNADISGPLATNFNESLISKIIFIEEIAFENVVGKMSAILSGPEYVNPFACWLHVWDLRKHFK